MANSTSKSSKENTTRLPDFEEKLAELERIVTDLEKGDLTLEQSLQAYEQGINLTRECQSALDVAQQRINVLMEKNGVATEEPLPASTTGSD
jgi:exodeoxyribonuclease VII small subunit